MMVVFVMKTKSLRRPRAARAAKGRDPPSVRGLIPRLAWANSLALASCYHNIHHYHHHLPRTLFVRSTSVFTVISPPFSFLFFRPLSARPLCHPSLSGQ